MATAASDPLQLLIKALSANREIVLLQEDQQTQTFTLPECQYISLPASGSSRVVLPKNTPTRYKGPTGHFDLQSLLFAYLQRESDFKQYLNGATSGGIVPVSIMDRKGVVELLSQKREEGPEVEPLEVPGAIRSTTPDGMPGEDALPAGVPPSKDDSQRPAKKAKYTVNAEDRDAVKKLMSAQEPKQIMDRETVLRGPKPANFESLRTIFTERIKTAKEDLRRFEKGGAAAPVAAVSGKPVSGKKRPSNPIIIVSPSTSALISMFNVKRFLEEGIYQSTAEARLASGSTKQEDVVSINHKRQIGLATPGQPTSGGSSLGSSVYGDGGSSNSGEKNARYFVVDSVEALSKFGDDAWDRVVCVMTTGQEWQFRQYRWPEPKELFHHVKGISFSWTKDAANEKVKGWNVTELKLDPVKRHIDKSVAADFWARLESWITLNKPYVSY